MKTKEYGDDVDVFIDGEKAQEFEGLPNPHREISEHVDNLMRSHSIPATDIGLAAIVATIKKLGHDARVAHGFRDACPDDQCPLPIDSCGERMHAGINVTLEGDQPPGSSGSQRLRVTT